MYFVRLTTPLDVAPSDILGRVVVHPKDPLRELVPTPAVHAAASVPASGDVHILVGHSAALDAFLPHMAGEPGIAAALARSGCLYFVQAARTEHGRIVDLAYKVILSQGSPKDTDPETNMFRKTLGKWMEDHRVSERAVGALVNLGISALVPPPIGLVIGGGAGFIVSDYVAPSVKSLLKNIASGAKKSEPVFHLTRGPAVGLDEVETTPTQRETETQDNVSWSPSTVSGAGEFGCTQDSLPYAARAKL